MQSVPDDAQGSQHDGGSCLVVGHQRALVSKSSEHIDRAPPLGESPEVTCENEGCVHVHTVIKKALFMFQVPALFDEVAIYFSDEEWEVLTEQQKALYREVMRMNYETVLSLEFPFPRTEMINWVERKEQCPNSDEWRLQGVIFAENEESDLGLQIGQAR